LREQLVQAQNRADKLETKLRQTTLEGDIAPSSSGSVDNHLAEVGELDPVRYIEQLLVSNERLRDERDGLRADLSFLEAESKFALEAMETKLVALSPHDKHLDDSKENFANATACHQEVLSRKEKNVQRLGLIATASMIIVQHLQSQILSTNNQSISASSQLASAEAQLERANSACLIKDQTIAELDNKVSDLQMRCKVTSLDLDAAAAQRTKLFAQIKRLEANEVNLALEGRRAKDSQIQMQDMLDRMNSQILKDRKSLEEVESQRDALVLQVNNLQSDLGTALQQLNEAQDRYSTLQAHQLSSMSSGEVTNALREQIKELEERVLRRTEQIGIHQHDIRRLEMNLGLQEERTSEMTAELEMSAAEKAAMVEDCADAREARDEALQKVEWLEMEVEVREDQLADVAEQLAQRSAESVTMVELLMGSIARVRIAETTALRHSRSLEELERTLQDAEAGHETAVANLEQLRNEHQKTVLLLGDRNLASEASENHTNALNSDLTQMTLALAISQVDLRASNIAKVELEKRVTTLENDLETPGRRHTNTTVENDNILVTRISDLETKLQQSQEEIDTMVKRHEDVVHELHQRLDENEQSSRRQLDATSFVRAELEDELRAKREQLERLSVGFEDMHKRCVDLEERCQQLAKSRGDTEELLRRTSAELSQTKENQAAKQVEFNELSVRLQQLEEKCTHRLDEINRLQVRLDGSTQALQEVECKMLEEAANHVQEKERADEELRCMKERHQHAEEVQVLLRAQIKNSFEELEAMRSEKETLQMNMTTLEAEIQRSLSLQRFLESQVTDKYGCFSGPYNLLNRNHSENKITSLTEAVDRTRAELIKAENAATTSQVSLAFQKAEHEKILSALREDIVVLRSRPNLEPVIAEMERKNSEMERILRSKCEEVEENDDRFIEYAFSLHRITEGF
jgi:chromosome segregation ATPase